LNLRGLNSIDDRVESKWDNHIKISHEDMPMEWSAVAPKPKDKKEKKAVYKTGESHRHESQVPRPLSQAS
jgi:hypothetical protein